MGYGKMKFLYIKRKVRRHPKPHQCPVQRTAYQLLGVVYLVSLGWYFPTVNWLSVLNTAYGFTNPYELCYDPFLRSSAKRSIVSTLFTYSDCAAVTMDQVGLVQALGLFHPGGYAVRMVRFICAVIRVGKRSSEWHGDEQICSWLCRSCRKTRAGMARRTTMLRELLSLEEW